MPDTSAPYLDSGHLQQLARERAGRPACAQCAALACPGWESVPGGFERGKLRRIGTLRREGDDDPTPQEYLPAGTSTWSANAPIAPAFAPYNRCEVWECAACARAFLRYTEYGGYYQEERIRELNADLVVPATL